MSRGNEPTVASKPAMAASDDARDVNMHDSEPVSSAEQEAWTDLADAVRSQLAKIVPMIPAMKQDELKSFIETLQAAYWFEHNARLWDKKYDDELKRLFTDP